MYNPKIYIRDYGAPTRRVLAFRQPYDLDFSDSDLRRDLIIHAENSVAGEEFMLLSGDQQSGSDVVDLTGIANDLLVLTNDVAMRFFGSDTPLLYSNISGFPSWGYEVTLNEADIRRALLFQADGAAAQTAVENAGLLRSLLMSASPTSVALSGNDAAFLVGNIVSTDVISYLMDGSDAALLRSLPMAATTGAYAWAGIDATFVRSLIMAAQGTLIGATFNDANVSTDSLELVSGDQQSGSDSTLLSGDQQTDEDFLLIS